MKEQKPYKLNLDGERNLTPKSEGEVRLNDIYDIKFQKNGVYYYFKITNLRCKSPTAERISIKATDIKKPRTLESQIEDQIKKGFLSVDSDHLDHISKKITEVVKTMNVAYLSAKNEIKNINKKFLFKDEKGEEYQSEVERRFYLGFLKEKNLIETSKQLKMF